MIFDQLVACARVSDAIATVAHLVPADRRDEFVLATAQIMGCVLGIPADRVQSVSARVTAEWDVRDAARRAGQS